MNNKDLTNNKTIEQERYFLAAVVDSSQDSIVTIDFDNVITSWNKAAEELYGFPAEEAIGKNLSLVVLPADIRELFRKVDVIKNNGQVKIYETIRLHKGGRLIDLEIMLSPVKDSSKRVIGVSTIARNITARRIAEEALKKSERRFRAIVSQATIGVYQTDLKGVFVFANRKICDMLGYSENEMTGKSIWEITYADDLPVEREVFEKMINSDQHFEVEKRLVRKDDSIIWVNESITTILNENGEPESTIGILLDVTERKRLEKQKDEFIGIASHELKTPLTSVKAYGQILEGAFNRSDFGDAPHLIKKLNRQIDRLHNLVNELLDTSDLAQGRFTLQKEIFDMNDLVRERLDDFKQLSDKHKLLFRPGTIINVCADRIRIDEVLNNLISNAIKYSPDGGKVYVTTEQVEAGVKLTVEDEGIGIPQSSVNQVFDPFFRGRHHDTVIRGSGLGLYISAGIIRSHGGQIGVRSELGKGSVFHFVLPFVNERGSDVDSLCE